MTTVQSSSNCTYHKDFKIKINQYLRKSNHLINCQKNATCMRPERAPDRSAKESPVSLSSPPAVTPPLPSWTSVHRMTTTDITPHTRPRMCASWNLKQNKMVFFCFMLVKKMRHRTVYFHSYFSLLCREKILKLNT